MTEFERFAEALALTESGNRELSWGDPKDKATRSMIMYAAKLLEVQGGDFLAMGRFQMHAVWYAEWADPAIAVGWSWDQAFRAALKRFWDAYRLIPLAVSDIAQVFHLGRSAFERGDLDHDYALRFSRFWGQLGGA